MERNRGGTTAGLVVWTPAPAYSSPSSPEGSDFTWDEEADVDFQSQMDENGIIGLEESQGQLEVSEIRLNDNFILMGHLELSLRKVPLGLMKI